MREVKYRVYDKNKNKTFQVIRLCKSLEGDCEVDYCYYLNERNELEWLPLTDGILMQYTGLNDRNDKEIYEGYIVKLTIRHYMDCSRAELTNEETTTQMVVFEYHTFGFTDGKGIKPFIWILGFDYDIEVIGNIHNNPELLNN